MSGLLFPPPFVTALDDNGAPISGATLTFYLTGTSTLATVFSDADTGTPLSNPVVADAAGRFPAIYLPASLLRVVLKDAGGAVIPGGDIDPINSDLAATLAGSAGSAGIGFIQAGAGAVARTVQDKARETISLQDYGAVGDGVTDDTAEINAAIAAAKASGAPTTIVLNGSFVISSTIVIDASNIALAGAGGDASHDVGTQGASARGKLIWAGSAGGTMLRFASPVGAGNQCLTGGGVTDLYFAADNVAAIGLQVQSWRKGKFQNLHFSNPTTVGVDVGVVATLGEARDVQNCEFRNISSRHLETTGGTGGLIRLDGDATANTSLNYFEQLDCQYLNGTAYLFNNSDNNYLVRLRAFRGGGGTGAAIVFNGSNAAAGQVARSNIIVHPTFNGLLPITMRGTTTFTHPSLDNSVLLIDYDNSYAAPTFETGATGQWSDTRGVNARFNFVSVAMGDDVTNAVAARARLGVSTLHLVNGAQSHLELSDTSGTNEWGLSIDGGGNLRVSRAAGAGSFNIGGAVTYNSKTVSEGAADSGGAGFRVLRVPN